MGQPLGQHFLGDSEVIREFVDLLGDLKGKKVLEIGAGTGMLTTALCRKKPKWLTALEKDESLIPKLQERLADAKAKNVQVVNADVLDYHFGGFDWIVGNIPFYLSSDILFKTIGAESNGSGAFFLQKEFADRLVATPGSAQWGRLSVNAQNHADIQLAMDVSRYSFTPPPEVDVAVVILRRKPPKAIDERLVELLFSHKNQKVKKAFEHSWVQLGLSKKEAKEKGASLPFAQRRVRELDLDEWVKLSAAVGNG
ncbi:ribosomal RNA small subunit methyltransferase A [Candidatus Micrarchaeota archaeon]|nr:ribosomal RNA small subunit methyltransferase A [Candidatus Micrarchaeota archaeon]